MKINPVLEDWNPAMSSPAAAMNAILCDHSTHLGVSSCSSAMTSLNTSGRSSSAGEALSKRRYSAALKSC